MWSGWGGVRDDEVLGLRGWKDGGGVKGKGRSEGEQVGATGHARVELQHPLMFLDRGVQAIGNVRPEL